jgi:MYXO-CTERM domain-containing protein
VTTACDAPEGYAAATIDDCDDDDATSNPEADDLPGDGIDQDCDGRDATSGDTDDTDDGLVDDKDAGTGCGCTPTRSVGAGWSLVLGVLALTLHRRRAA